MAYRCQHPGQARGGGGGVDGHQQLGVFRLSQVLESLGLSQVVAGEVGFVDVDGHVTHVDGHQRTVVVYQVFFGAFRNGVHGAVFVDHALR